MSKRYKGKTCTYCTVAGASTTGDHVFAREFFPIDKRENLPQVPACERCNNEKAKLEHYLTAVMPFGARHADAHQVLNGMVEPRLARNLKLQKSLSAGRETVWERRGGLLAPAMRLPFQADKLEALAMLWARGLAQHHFRVVIPADHNVVASMVTGEGDAQFRAHMLTMNGNRVIGNLGTGAFEYHGLQGVVDEHVTAWRITVYGGVRLGGDPEAPNQDGSHIWAFSSRSEALARLLAREPA